jgi:AGCS family alanine or glycine:cation symporter
MITDIISILNGLLWGNILVYLLVGTGLFFTLRLGFIQFRNFRHGIQILRLSQSSESGLSSIQVFFTSMAARVGTGNMAGVAVAIVSGGPGAIFWMWITALIGMATAIIESTLAQVYKVKDKTSKEFIGGPAYYMEQGLGMRWMGVLFSIFLIIAFGLVFIAVQANTITDSLKQVVSWNEVAIGMVLVLMTSLVIVGGIRRVAQVATKVVPIMAGLYIFIALVVVIINISELPSVLTLIVKSAFGWHEAASGVLGYSVAQAMQVGVARGLFSNEAGMGSAANIAASAAPNPNHPASQGFVQMIGVFFDTIVLCTATAAIVLLTRSYENPGNLNGVSLLQSALANEIGDWSVGLVSAAIFLFCFTTIIANYSYAESNVLFLSRGSRTVLLPFRMAVLGMVMFGSVAKLQLVWDMADVSMGLMALVNLLAILMLSGIAIPVIQDYNKQLKEGKMPKFQAKDFPKLKNKTQVW